MFMMLISLLSGVCCVVWLSNMLKFFRLEVVWVLSGFGEIVCMWMCFGLSLYVR